MNIKNTTKKSVFLSNTVSDIPSDLGAAQREAETSVVKWNHVKAKH